MGFVIQELSATTTDFQWAPSFVVGAKTTYKQASLVNLFIYLNTQKNMTTPIADAEKMKAVVQDSSRCQYLLRPVNGRVRLRINKDIFPSPRISMESSLDSISLSFSEIQYHSILDLVTGITTITQQHSLENIQIKESFQEGTNDEKIRYIQLYKRTLNATWLPELNEEEKKEKLDLETKLIYADIAKWRSLAIAELRTELRGKMVTTRQPVKKQGFFSRMIHGKKDPHELDEAPDELTEAQKKNLYEEFEYNPTESKSTDLPRDYVSMRIGFGLDELSLSLLDRNEKMLIKLEATKTTVNMDQRPTSMSLRLALHRVGLMDYTTPKTLYPSLLTITNTTTQPQPRGSVWKDAANQITTTSTSTTQPLLSIAFDSNPLDQSADTAIVVNSQGLQLVIHARYVDRIIRFFQPPKPVDLTAVSTWGANNLLAIKQVTSVSLADAFKSYSSRLLTINMAAPTFVIPVDPTDGRSDVLVLDLGRLGVSTSLQPKANIQSVVQKLSTLPASSAFEDSLSETEKSSCYDRINLSVTAIQMFIATQGPKWNDDQKQDNRAYLLAPFDINLAIDQCVAPDIVWLPRVRVDGRLPVLELRVSVTKLARMMKLAASFSGIGGSSSTPTIDVLDDDSKQVKAVTQQPQDMFANADRDKILTLPELTAALGSQKDAKKLLAEVDVNGDGEVTYGEYQTWYNQRKHVIKLNRMLQASFSIPHLVVTVTNDRVAQNTYEVITFRIDGVSLDLDQRTYDMSIQARVAGMYLEDKKSGSIEKYIVNTKAPEAGATAHLAQPTKYAARKPSTSSAENFVSVNVQTLSPESPDFESNPIAQRIDVAIGYLILSLDPEVIHRIGRFAFQELLPAVQSGAAQTKEIPESKALAVPTNQLAPPKTPVLSATPSKTTAIIKPTIKTSTPLIKRTSRTNMHLTASFGGLAVNLNANDQKLSTIAITGLRLVFLQYVHSMSVNVQLRDISMSDLTAAGAQYSHIMHCVHAPTSVATPSSLPATSSTPLISIAYDTYSPQETEFHDINTSIKGVIQGLRFCFLQRFIQELTLFFTAGHMKKAIDMMSGGGNGSDIMTKTASFGIKREGVSPSPSFMGSTPAPKRSIAPSTPAPFSYMALDIVLNDVELIIPRDSKSTQHVMARINKISVGSSRKEDDGKPYQHIDVILDAFTVTSDGDEKLIQISTFTVHVDQLAHRHHMDIHTDLAAMNFMLSQYQFAFLMSILNGNMAEKSTVMKMDDVKGLTTTTSKSVTKNNNASSRRSSRDIISPMASPQDDMIDASTATPSSMSIKVSLKHLDLELREGRGQTKEQSLMIFAMDAVHASVEMASDGAQTISAHLQSIILTDTSRANAAYKGAPVVEAYRELLSLSRPTDQEPPFTFTLNKTGTSTPHADRVMLIAIAMNDFRFTFGAVLFQISSIFVIPPSNNKVEDVTHTDTMQIEARKMIEAAQASLPADVRKKLADIEEEDDYVNVSREGSPLTRERESFVIVDHADRKQEEKKKEKNNQKKSATSTPIIYDEKSQDSLVQSIRNDTQQRLEEQKQSVPMELRVKIRNPIIQLITDPTKKKTTALTLTWALDAHVSMSYQNTEVHAALNDVRVLHSDLTTKQGQLTITTKEDSPIIAPFSLKALVHQYQSRTLQEQAMMVDLDMDRLNITFTYQDYQLMLEAINALAIPSTPAPADKKKAVTSPQSKLLELKSDEKDEKDEKHDSIMKVEPISQLGMSELVAESIPEPEPEMAEPISSFGEQTIILRIGGLNLLLINDCLHYNVPIARFYIDDISTKLHSFSHDRHILAQLNIRADYYNNRMVAWEPLIDHPWKLSTTVHQAINPLQPSHAPSMAVQLHAQSGFDINVTNAMFESLLDALSLLSRSSTGVADSQAYFPYRVDNQTEFDVIFKLAKPELKSEGLFSSIANAARIGDFKQDEYKVSAYSDLGYSFPDIGVPYEHVLELQFNTEYGYPPITLPVSRQKSTTLTLQNKDSPVAVVVCDIAVVNGTKFLSLHSRVAIMNDTRTPIQIAKATSDMKLKKAIVDPNELMWLPLLQLPQTQKSLIEGITLKLRPQDNKHGVFKWSDNVIVRHPHAIEEKERTILAHCARDESAQQPSAVTATGNLTSGMPTFSMSLYADANQENITAWAPDAKESDDQAVISAKQLRGNMASVYHIRTPITIENALPFEIHTRLAEVLDKNDMDNAKIIAGKKIKCGHEFLVTGSTYAPSTYISVSLPSHSCDWTIPIPLREGHSQFHLTDHAKRELYIDMDCLIHRGSLRVVLYVQYALIDLTALNIKITPDKFTHYPMYKAKTDMDEKHALPDEKDMKLDDWRRAAMFSFEYSGKDAHQRPMDQHVYACAQPPHTEKSDWSPGFSLDQVGSVGSISIPVSPESASMGAYAVSLSISPAPGKFHRTKIVTFVPQFTIVNQMKYDLRIRQYGTEQEMTLPAHASQTYHWNDPKKRHLLSFRRTDPAFEGYNWSGYFDPTVVGDTPLNIRHHTGSLSWFVRSRVVLNQATAYIFITEYETQNVSSMRWILPYTIENRCIRQSFRFRQIVEDQQHHGTTPQWIVLGPSTSIPYTWEEPLLDRRIQVQTGVTRDAFGQILRYERQDLFHLDDVCEPTIIKVMNDEERRLGVSVEAQDARQRSSQVKLYAWVESIGPTHTFVLSDVEPPKREIPKLNDDKSLKRHQQSVEQQRIRTLVHLLHCEKRLQTEIHQLNERLKQDGVYLNTLQKLPYRRPSIPEHTSELRLQVHATRAFPNKRSMYVKIRFHHDERRTATVKGAEPVFNESFAFNATGATLQQPVYIEIFESGLFDECLGHVKIPLSDLQSYVPVEKWYAVDGPFPTGGIKLWLWLIPPSPSVIETQVHSLTQRVSERQRVLTMVSRQMRELVPRQVTTEIAGETITLPINAPSTEFSLKLVETQTLKGLAKFLDLDPETGRIVCQISCPLLERSSEVVILEKGVDITKEWTQQFTFFVPNQLLENAPPERAIVTLTYILYPAAKKRNVISHIRPQEIRRETLLQQAAAAAGSLSMSSSPSLERALSDHLQEDTFAHAWYSPVPIRLGESTISLLSIPVTDRLTYEERLQYELQIKKKNKSDPKQEWIQKQVTVHPSHPEAKVTVTVTRHIARPEDQRPHMSVGVHLPCMGLSLVDERPQELLYISLHGLHLTYEDSTSQQTVEFALRKLQIDNQTYRCAYPVIFAPSPVSPGDLKPFIQLSINKTKDDKIPVMMFQYLSLLIQKMDLRIEERLIYIILGYINEFARRHEQTKASKEGPTKRIGKDTKDYEKEFKRQVSKELAIPETNPTYLYFNLLQLQPIALNLSFQIDPGVRAHASHSSDFLVNPFSVVLSLLGATFGSIDSAPIRLNGKVIDCCYGTADAIIGSLVQHYTQQGLRQVYKILGSFEFLGNPIGLVNNLGTGVVDFFHEPAKGLVLGPQEFGKGLAKGSASLVKSTISGIFGAASKITGSVGKGFAVLTFDDDFIRRNNVRNQKQPEHVGEGVVQGGKSLATGVYKGITGLVMDPIHGAQKDGMTGFAKGLGKGLVGVVAKPASGVVDATSQTLKGIANTATYLLDDSVANRPIRPQRYVDPATRILTAYDEHEAMSHSQDRKVRKEAAKKRDEELKSAGKRPIPATSPTSPSEGRVSPHSPKHTAIPGPPVPPRSPVAVGANAPAAVVSKSSASPSTGGSLAGLSEQERLEMLEHRQQMAALQLQLAQQQQQQ